MALQHSRTRWFGMCKEMHTAARATPRPSRTGTQILFAAKRNKRYSECGTHLPGGLRGLASYIGVALETGDHLPLPSRCDSRFPQRLHQHRGGGADCFSMETIAFTIFMY